MSTREIALVAILSSLATTLRLLKNLTLGPLQFINIPLIFAILAGRLIGALGGGIVGATGFLLTDLFLGFGPWSLVNASVNGVIGSVWGLLKGKKITPLVLAACIYLSALSYDIISSTAFYLIFGLNLRSALLTGLIGLFIPVYGGGLIGVGPITELSTTVVTLGLIRAIKRINF
ncbi:MAG: hypothetical protein B6U69_00365 [Thermofilum sp. ex4484_15]|nr:MAG: hypothetical protein B6U69_00365 [Thermofilum sp. ex4484_15]